MNYFPIFKLNIPDFSTIPLNFPEIFSYFCPKLKDLKRIFLTAMLFAGLTASAQNKQFAVTEFSTNYLRTAPDYESALETQELMGAVVEVTGQNGYWRQIVTPQPYTAWCTDLGLAFMSEDKVSEYIKTPKYIFTSLYGHVYSAASEKSETVCDLVAGAIMRKVDVGQDIRRAGKVKVKGEWAEVMLPSGKRGFVKKSDIRDFRLWAESAEANAGNIISTAKMFAGVPYLWGGMSSKGLDCSGLTRLTWLLNGVLLPRNASQQVRTGDDVAVDPDNSFGADSDGLREEMLRRVRNLEPGDLVFFGKPKDSAGDGTTGTGYSITHVGIYIGDNHIIHSSHMVRINSLIPGESDYYENSHRLVKARRIIGAEGKGKGIIPIIDSPAYF